MSLVITSSSKGQTNPAGQNLGIRSPGSYQNTFRSPFKIEGHSEVAVQSVRLSRQGYHFVNDVYFCCYFGKILAAPEKISTAHVTNQPLYVKIPSGSYTKIELAEQLTTDLGSTLKTSYPNIVGVVVEINVDAGGAFEGFKFTMTQLGAGTAFANVPADGDWIPTIGPLTRYNDGSDELEEADSGAVSASLQVVTASASLAGAINTSYPLSLCTSTFEVDITNASNGGFEVGLVRNLYDPQGAGGGLYTNAPEGFLYHNNDAGSPGGESSFYDFGFRWVPGNNGELFQYLADSDNDPNNIGSMRDLADYPVMLDASFSSSPPGYDKVRFTIINEEVSFAIHTTGGAWSEIINKTVSTAANRLFKPTGLTTQALYPKIYIANASDSLEVTTWNGISNAGNVYDFYANKLFGLPNSGQARTVQYDCDTNLAYQLNGANDYDINYTRMGVNGAGGQDNKHVFIFAPSAVYDTIMPGYLHLNLANYLGFTKPIFEADDDTLISTITSTQAPINFGSNAMYVRVNTLPFNSLNGATEGISQILYACPRFDITGNEIGNLYFEPNTPIYLDLKNTESYVLSDISVDIVDINEKVATDLHSDTTVILHVRKKDHRNTSGISLNLGGT